MTKVEMEPFRQQLLNWANRLKGDVSGLSADALRGVGGEASGNLSNAPLHSADLGSDTFEQEVSLSLLETEEQTLEAIAHALNRINDGTYGTCEECGKPIAAERLRAVPYTTACIDCARKAEPKRSSNRT